MTVAHPERIQAMIIQNAVSHEEGLSPLWAVRRAFWQDRTDHEAEARANLLSLETTRKGHLGTSLDSSQYNPDLWVDEYYFLTSPDRPVFNWICFTTIRTTSNPIQSGNNGYAIINLPSWYCGVATAPHLPSPAPKRIAEMIQAQNFTSSMRGISRWT